MTHRIKFVVLSLIAVGIAGCATSDHGASFMTKPQWKKGDQKLSGKQKSAEPKSPAILPKTHFAAAQLLARQGLVREAIAQYRKAVALNHEYVEAYHDLGILLLRIGERKAATATLRRAASLRPESALLRNNVGYALMRQGKWAEAIEELRRSTEIEPFFARAHVNLGIALAKLDRFDESLESFLAVLPNADAHYNLGLMYRARKMYPQAAEAFGKVLAIDANFLAAATQLESLEARLEPEQTIAEVPVQRDTLPAQGVTRGAPDSIAMNPEPAQSVDPAPVIDPTPISEPAPAREPTPTTVTETHDGAQAIDRERTDDSKTIANAVPEPTTVVVEDAAVAASTPTADAYVDAAPCEEPTTDTEPAVANIEPATSIEPAGPDPTDQSVVEGPVRDRESLGATRPEVDPAAPIVTRDRIAHTDTIESDDATIDTLNEQEPRTEPRLVEASRTSELAASSQPTAIGDALPIDPLIPLVDQGIEPVIESWLPTPTYSESSDFGVSQQKYSDAGYSVSPFAKTYSEAYPQGEAYGDALLIDPLLPIADQGTIAEIASWDDDLEALLALEDQNAPCIDEMGLDAESEPAFVEALGVEATGAGTTGAGTLGSDSSVAPRGYAAPAPRATAAMSVLDDSDDDTSTLPPAPAPQPVREERLEGDRVNNAAAPETHPEDGLSMSERADPIDWGHEFAEMAEAIASDTTQDAYPCDDDAVILDPATRREPSTMQVVEEARRLGPKIPASDTGRASTAPTVSNTAMELGAHTSFDTGTIDPSAKLVANEPMVSRAERLRLLDQRLTETRSEILCLESRLNQTAAIYVTDVSFARAGAEVWAALTPDVTHISPRLVSRNDTGSDLNRAMANRPTRRQAMSMTVVPKRTVVAERQGASGRNGSTQQDDKPCTDDSEDPRSKATVAPAKSMVSQGLTARDLLDLFSITSNDLSCWTAEDIDHILYQGDFPSGAGALAVARRDNRTHDQAYTRARAADAAELTRVVDEDAAPTPRHYRIGRRNKMSPIPPIRD